MIFKKVKFTSIMKVLLLVVAPFFFCFIFFYIYPVFLNKNNYMFFPEVAPRFTLIGIDLRWLWSVMKSWSAEGFDALPGMTKHFPPAILYFYGWMSFLNFEISYKLNILFTLISYLFCTLVIPMLMNRKSIYSNVSILISLLGLTSYGILFEIERGQWNLITFGICWIAAYMINRGDKLLLYGLIFLSIAIQLKFWPIFFAVLIFKINEKYYNNIKNILYFLIINFALFMIEGADVFLAWVDSIFKISNSTEFGVAQVSIEAFIWLINQDKFEIFLIPGFLLIVVSLMLGLINSLILIFSTSIDNNSKYIGLTFAITMACVFLPTHSNDYKLSIMAPLGALVLPYMLVRASKVIDYFLVLAVSFALFSTFYSYDFKTAGSILQNNMIMILIFLSSFSIFQIRQFFIQIHIKK